MQKRSGSALGAFLLVPGFAWIVFDSVALGMLFGLMAAAAAGKAVGSPSTPAGRDG